MFKTLNYDEVHAFVDKHQGHGQEDIFWNGWTLCYWKKNPAGATSQNGMFRNGKWGIVRRIKPNSNGEWRILVNNVRPAARTRSRS